MAEIIRPTRRGLITGLAALITAPAIVRAANIMPVRTVVWTPELLIDVPTGGDVLEILVDGYRWIRHRITAEEWDTGIIVCSDENAFPAGSEISARVSLGAWSEPCSVSIVADQG